MMQDEPIQQVNQDDEITLKDIITNIREYWKELWKNKFWIILATIPLALYFGYKAKNSPWTYKAQLTYTLDGAGESSGGLAGILGSFGLGGSSEVNLDRIVELSKSRNIIQKVLFSSVALDTFKGRPDFIANHLISLHKLDKVWTNKYKDWSGFKFRSDSIQKFDRNELAALKLLYGNVINGTKDQKPIFTNGFSKLTGILSLVVNTADEELSIEFCNLVFSKLEEFYVKGSTKGSENRYEFVKQKTDSIFSLLKSKEFQLSRFNDSHRNLVDPNLLTERKLIETEIFKLKAMYGEVTKNKEVADFSLIASVPDITVIDPPILPLDVEAESFLIGIIKGILLGGFLSVGFIIARKIVTDALKA
jgi:hypothetical protein